MHRRGSYGKAKDFTELSTQSDASFSTTTITTTTTTTTTISSLPLVCVTGACGYGASHLVRKLVETGLYRVRAVDVRLPSLSSPITAVAEAFVKDVEYILCDVTNFEQVKFAVKDCITVFHLAAIVPYNLSSTFSKKRLLQVNVEGTRNVIKACLSESSVRNLLFASSTGVVFQGHDIQHGTEEELEEIARNGPYNDAYSESKALAEKAVREATCDKLATLSIRPNGIWGPGEMHHTPKLLLMARLGFAPLMAVEPNALTDFTHRDNLAHAFILGMKNLEDPISRKRVSGKAYFITDGWAAHTLEFFSVLLKLLGFSTPFPSKITLLDKKGSCCERVSRSMFNAAVEEEEEEKKKIIDGLSISSSRRIFKQLRKNASVVSTILTTDAYFPLPGFVLYPAAAIAQGLSSLLQPIYNFEPFLTLADVRKVVKHNYYSSELAKKELGFTSVINTAEMMKEAADYYKSKGYNGHVTSAGYLPWLLAPPGILFTYFISTNPYNVLDFVSIVSKKFFITFGVWLKPHQQTSSRILIPTIFLDSIDMFSLVNTDHVSYYLSKILRSIFIAACIVHCIHACIVFQLALHRNLAAGQWAFQAFFLGFPSTGAFCKFAKIQITEIQVMIISLICFGLLTGVLIML